MPTRPLADEYASIYAGYVSLVPESDALAVLEEQRDAMLRLEGSLPADREAYTYAPGKWTVREVIGHLADAERVLGFRAFCFSRRDPNSLPGFDENAYIENSPYAATPLRELAREFASLRDANLAALRRLDEARWMQRGTANGSPITVRALAFIMAGHMRHHQAVLKERYGVSLG